MSTLEERVRSFVDGVRPLEFERITFKSRNERPRPSITGRGCVRRMVDGAFQVSCDIDKLATAVPTPKTWTIRAPLAGSFFAEDDFYDMEAIDLDGNIWTSERVIIPALDFFPPDFPPGLMQSFTCRTGYLQLDNSASVRARYLRIEYVSESRDNWAPFVNREIEFYLQPIGQRFTISFGVGGRADVVETIIKSDNPIPIGFEHTISEALSFVFDESLDPRIFERNIDDARSITLARSLASDYDPSPVIIIRGDLHLHINGIRNLLELYISYIMDRSAVATNRFHPCTYLLRLARLPAHTTIDASILTACVVAEAIAWLPAFGVATEIGADDLIDARQEFERLVSGSKYSERTKKRLLGALKRVGEPGVRAQFDLLIEQGMILNGDFQAWQELRHRYAHLKQTTFANESNILERLIKLRRIHRMIRCIMFACIGYNGEFSDYVTEGYPSVKYPFRVES
jgi:hypothetical protein